MSKWKKVVELEVDPLKFVVLKTDKGSFRTQVFNGENLKVDVKSMGKYAVKETDKKLYAMGVTMSWEPCRQDDLSGGYGLDHSYGNYKYSLKERLSPERQAQVDTVKGLERIIRGFVGNSGAEQDALNAINNICFDLRDLWDLS